jgi:Mg2+/citrate symporter
MVPLEVMPLAIGWEEFDEAVERGLLREVEEVVLFEEAARVALFACVGLGLTVTVVMVVLEKWIVEVARAGAALMVALLFFDDVEAGAVFSAAVERLTPVAWATPADVVLFEKSATVALAREVLAESS